MEKLRFPIVIPSYWCQSPSFESYICDMKVSGVSKFIILADYDIQFNSIKSFKLEIKGLKSILSEMSEKFNVRFKVCCNLLLDNRLFDSREISIFASKKSDYLFVTLPIVGKPDIAMKNIFTIRNSGLKPIIFNFNNVVSVYPKAFNEALLTTENMSFVFDDGSLNDYKIYYFIKLAQSINNKILFSTDHLTSSVLIRNIESFTRKFHMKQKTFLKDNFKKLTTIFFK